ncbi:MAG: cob(I)yrinic acid a,c-diamide adenosyltransferase [Patescibacteria group bacterium]|nr:cob(I)yrinic acid a,c-diamide adenosyltransferase [Patescibacteria group bacterium]MDE2116666.1 cob(I)yrinic acid a,c-diamide adenosyltransferase [Patescibacteria group bacterium]
MLIVFTGNGKGKTTAAIGQALRAIGNGSHVLMVQFIKGPWKSGEDESVKALDPNFRIEKMGRGFVKTPCDKLPFSEHVAAAHKAFDHALAEARTGKWEILIMDEIWVALSLGLLTATRVRDFIDEVLGRAAAGAAARPLCEHLIMTGRGCPQEFIDRADLVTEMKEVKHPFATGVSAAKNVEF